MARKFAVAVIGSSVLALGVALVVLPGPAILVIPLGLGILATEFLWAGNLLRQFRNGIHELKQYVRRQLGKPRRPPAMQESGAARDSPLDFRCTI